MSLWIPVVAALGASILTSFGTLMLDLLRRRNDARSTARASRRNAYEELIVAANGVLVAGQVLRALRRVQTGFAATVAELIRLRRPADPGEVGWRVASELRPLLDAQVRVLACGTPAAVAAASNVANTVNDYLAAAVAMTPAQRLLMGLAPWRPTREQDEILATRLADAGRAIGTFKDLMRSELGEEPLTSAQS